MKFNQQLREQLYNAGYTISPEAKRLEVEENIKAKEERRQIKSKEKFAREIRAGLWDMNL